MKHNHNAEVDLDQLIMAMLRGMEKALLAYPKLAGGLIFCLGREFDLARNQIIVEKAIKYHRRGVVGIDLAGADTNHFMIDEYQKLFAHAKQAGLKITAHTGEHKTDNDMWEVVEKLSPDRIGHGIYAAYDKELMNELKRRQIVLEICPFSNLATKAVENIDEMRFILRTFVENNVPFTINTDWPEVIRGNHLHEQFTWLLEQKILSAAELTDCNKLAFEHSFVTAPGITPYL
jgi:adenosine deaminase